MFNQKTMKKIFMMVLVMLSAYLMTSCIDLQPGKDYEKLLAEAKDALMLVSETTEDIELPTQGLNEATITWESDNPSVISETGVVHRPHFDLGDKIVTLTATLTLDQYSDTKEFTVKVIKLDKDPDQEYIRRQLYTGQKYPITEGVELIIPENSSILKIATEGNQKYLYAIGLGIETAKRIEGIDVKYYEYEVLHQITSFGVGRDLGQYNENVLEDYLRNDELAPYTVGTLNPYRIDIVATAAVYTESLTIDDIDVEFGSFNVEYKLFEEGKPEVDVFATYATKEGNYVHFNDNAIGKTFTLEVLLPERDNLLGLDSVKQLLTVADGANIHSNQELKTYFADLNVSNIHIHRDIKAELNPEQYYEIDGKTYPYNHFDINVGIEEGKHGNVYLRYHSTNIGQLTVNGNYFTVDGSDLQLLVGSDDPEQGGYVDDYEEDPKVVSSQVAIFRFGVDGAVENDDNKVTFKNLSIIGNTNRPNADDLRLSGGLSGIRNDNSFLVTDNVNISYAINGIFSTYRYAKTVVEYSQISNSWAGNLLLWGNKYTEINNSSLTNSGSASVTLVDSYEDLGLENYNDPELVLNNTEIKNYVSGGSPWFVAYSLNNISTLVSGINAAMQNINLGAQAQGLPLNMTIYKEKESSEEASMFNFAILVQNGDPLDGSGLIQPQAKITIDGVTTYRPHDYRKSNPIVGGVAQLGAVFTPFGWDVANDLLNKFNANPDPTQINQYFAQSIIEGMMFAPNTIVDNRYMELYPTGFDSVFTIVEVYQNEVK